MKYCVNCHAELRDSDDFCRKCGTKVVVHEALTAEESIEIAKSIEKKLRELEEVNEEISGCERDLPRYTIPSNSPRHSAFKFFWPFLIYSQIAAFVVALIALFAFLGSGALYTRYFDAFESLVYLLAFIAEVVVLIIGGVYAPRKRNALNAQLAENESNMIQKRYNIESRLRELEARKNHIEFELKKYDGHIPPSMRNVSSIKKVRQYIEYGDARDFYEAVQMYQDNK